MKNSGNEIAAASAPSITVSDVARSAAIENAIALSERNKLSALRESLRQRYPKDAA